MAPFWGVAGNGQCSYLGHVPMLHCVPTERTRMFALNPNGESGTSKSDDPRLLGCYPSTLGTRYLSAGASVDNYPM